MLFNSFIFILCFMPLCMAGYFVLNRFGKYKLAECFLLAMSLWFYGYFNPWYVLVIVASVLINFAAYKLITKYADGAPRRSKGFMVAAVIINIAIIGYFKYMDFFIENVNSVFKTNLSLLNIALPLGISFFTFQQISFVADAYRGEIPDYGFIEYACFVTFFPQLIAGPIVTHSELVPQFKDLGKKHFDWNNFSRGFYIFAMGLAKKVIIADTFGTVIDYGYNQAASVTSTGAAIIILGYTLQIYFDFSGYCDMATGVAKMLNIDLPMNFDSPYKAATITEFWDRWHITLTRFLTKYVYIPLGGSRKGKVRTCINIMLVFLISGLWHGAGWTFVLWGAMHGLFMVIARLCKKVYEKIPRILNWAITFAFVNISWVFFRAESFEKAVLVLQKFFAFDFYGIDWVFLENFRRVEFTKILSLFNVESRFPYITVWGMFAAALLIALIPKNAREKMDGFKPGVVNLLLTVFLFVWSVFSITGMSTFLYFNF